MKIAVHSDGPYHYANLEAALRATERAVIDALFMDWFSLQDPNDPFSYCPNGQKKYTFSNSGCEAFFTLRELGSPTTTSDDTETIYRVYCDGYQCCKREMLICLDPVTHQIVRTETLISSGVFYPCSGSTPHIPEGITPNYVSPCTLSCPEN